jgi:hypothetical protein
MTEFCYFEPFAEPRRTVHFEVLPSNGGAKKPCRYRYYPFLITNMARAP